MADGQKLTPCLWFDRDGEEAAKFYVALLPNSRILSVSRYGPGMPLPAGTALMTEFELAGQRFQALNGGPVYKLTEAFSISVDCADQAEVDRLWTALTEGGQESRCGWLKDRFGVSWQVVPRAFKQLMSSGNGPATGRMMQAMMGMTKLDIAALEVAYHGR